MIALILRHRYKALIISVSVSSHPPPTATGPAVPYAMHSDELCFREVLDADGFPNRAGRNRESEIHPPIAQLFAMTRHIDRRSIRHSSTV